MTATDLLLRSAFTTLANSLVLDHGIRISWQTASTMDIHIVYQVHCAEHDLVVNGACRDAAPYGEHCHDIQPHEVPANYLADSRRSPSYCLLGTEFYGRHS